MSVKKQSTFSEFLLSVSEVSAQTLHGEGYSPKFQLIWFCGKDCLHDAIPCSGFNGQTRWPFSSQWSSLSVDECASGLDNGHEFTAGLCDGSASRRMGAFERFRRRINGNVAAEDFVRPKRTHPQACRAKLVLAQAAKRAGRSRKDSAGQLENTSRIRWCPRPVA